MKPYKALAAVSRTAVLQGHSVVLPLTTVRALSNTSSYCSFSLHASKGKKAEFSLTGATDGNLTNGL